MVCSPWVKRAISSSVAVLLLVCGSVGINSGTAAWAGSGRYTSSHIGEQLSITSVRMNPNGSGLLISANRSFSGNETQNFSVLRLPSPYRLLIDIPNARLATSQKAFSIGQNGIDRVELTDNNSPFYSSVRAVVYVNDSQTLSRITPVFEGNTLTLETPPTVAMTPVQMATTAFAAGNPPVPVKSRRAAKPLLPVVDPTPAIAAAKQPPTPPLQLSPVQQPQGPITVLGTPAPPGVQVVEEVGFRDNQLYIKGNQGAELHVKNRFTLTAPSRLVLDIENAVLSNRALMNPISGASEEFRQIRVGQFDDKTVRVVIETTIPEQFEAIYSGNKQNVLAISPYSSTSITKLSSNTPLGEVQSIDLKRDNGSTVLRLSASAPIVHRFIKKDNQVVLDLLNEASHATAINFDPKEFPELGKMRIDPLTEGQPNSKLTIKLASAGVRVTPTLSDDGRVMELQIMGDDSSSLGGALSNLIGLGAAGKAPFPARIVVDAGHGGKDMGANRSGVMEKDLNLSLALLLRDALVAKGFKVYMTRSTDVFLPLPQITAITNEVHPDLFISIHHNASVNPALNGLETYYYTPQSIALARRVHAREINAVGVRDGGVKQARFYVIHHTDVPAILCEVGYVSNPSELDDLQTMDRKLKTARAIADGVVDYLKTRVSASARKRANMQ
jgi:N-acetylmuramoyl-L-alanine amidase